MPPKNPNNPACPACGHHPVRRCGKDRYGRQRHQCHACRKVFTLEEKLCVVCGKPIPDERKRTNKCSDACEDARRKSVFLDYYYRKVAENPRFNIERHEAAKKRPGYEEYKAKQYRQNWEKLKADPEKYEAAKQKTRQWYAENRERIQAERRARVEAMSPEERAAWIERVRKSSRNYRRRWREELKAHPEKHQAYLDRMTEYHRQRELAKLLATMQEVKDRTK